MMLDSSTFQFPAIDTIHESATYPAAPSMRTTLYELAASIKQHGLIQPITVRPNEDGFEIVAGARRYRAAQVVELFSIPAHIVQIDDAQAIEWHYGQLVGKLGLLQLNTDTLAQFVLGDGPIQPQ